MRAAQQDTFIGSSELLGDTFVGSSVRVDSQHQRAFSPNATIGSTHVSTRAAPRAVRADQPATASVIINYRGRISGHRHRHPSCPTSRSMPSFLSDFSLPTNRHRHPSCRRSIYFFSIDLAPMELSGVLWAVELGRSAASARSSSLSLGRRRRDLARAGNMGTCSPSPRTGDPAGLAAAKSRRLWDPPLSVTPCA